MRILVLAGAGKPRDKMADTDVVEVSVTTNNLNGASGRGTGVEANVNLSRTATRVGGLRRTLPLNSRRLTVDLLRQLAGGLGVPADAAQGNLLTVIEEN